MGKALSGKLEGLSGIYHLHHLNERAANFRAAEGKPATLRMSDYFCQHGCNSAACDVVPVPHAM